MATITKPISSVKKKTKKRSPSKEGLEEDVYRLEDKAYIESVSNDALWHTRAHVAVMMMSAYTTFYKIWFPSQVVFDEVHFGKFAGYYLQRTFFFDVHPPLAKMMLATVGYLVGFNGVYDFSVIGDSYVDNGVPYIVLRAFPAFTNVLSTALIYQIMKASAYSPLTCFLSASFYALDNAVIAQHRLILLDSFLVFFMLATIYSYVRFRRHRHSAFTQSWWTWLLATGVCLGLTLSVKMVGLLLVMAIGIAVVIDLWDLLDMERQHTVTHILHQSLSRGIGLVLVPSAVYLSIFYIHFAILNTSGPGDGHMSTDFQRTLKQNALQLHSIDIMYNQSIRLQHKDTKAYLHSHPLHYPLQYVDGRISSQGQQVVGNLEPDLSSYWRIKPIDPLGEGGLVRHGDVIQLEHIITGTHLLTHDVASPLMPSNMEMTTVPDGVRHDETLFRVQLDTNKEGEIWTTMMRSVRLIHVKTGVAVWCHSERLPEWGLFHYEVNGNKLALQKTNEWTATDVLGIDAAEINQNKPETEVSMGFFSKFMELQQLMLESNAQLTAAHPFASRPLSWLLMSRGVSYWRDTNMKNQIYLTGNVWGWWLSAAGMVLFVSVCLIHAACVKRGMVFLNEVISRRWIRSGGFFCLLWACHFFPFFLMTRTLYLHHYLPALACNYLLLGSVFQFLFIQGVPSTGHSISYTHITNTSYAVASVLIVLQYIVYQKLSPTTYGTPGLLPEQLAKIQFLNSWDIQMS